MRHATTTAPCIATRASCVGDLALSCGDVFRYRPTNRGGEYASDLVARLEAEADRQSAQAIAAQAGTGDGAAGDRGAAPESEEEDEDEDDEPSVSEEDRVTLMEAVRARLQHEEARLRLYDAVARRDSARTSPAAAEHARRSRAEVVVLRARLARLSAVRGY